MYLKISSLFPLLLLLTGCFNSSLIDRADRKRHDYHHEFKAEFGLNYSKIEGARDPSEAELLVLEEDSILFVGLYIARKFLELPVENHSEIKDVGSIGISTKDSCPPEKPCKRSRKIILEKIKIAKAEIKNEDLTSFLFSQSTNECQIVVEEDVSEIASSDSPCIFTMGPAKYKTFRKYFQGIYFNSARLIGHYPRVEAYAKRQEQDVRGYLYLSQMDPAERDQLFDQAFSDIGKILHRKRKLKTPAPAPHPPCTRRQKRRGKCIEPQVEIPEELPPLELNLTEAEREKLYKALQGMCYNAHAINSKKCKIDNIKVMYGGYRRFYRDLEMYSEFTYKEYFNPRTRPDWVDTSLADVGIIKVRIQTIEDSEVSDFVKEAIESYWKTENYQTIIEFIDDPDAPSAVVSLIPDINPHASYKDSTLFLNSVSFQTDPFNKFIIAHEFGHLLGVHDCYVELYDTSAAEFVSYRLDQHYVMCSNSKGRANDSHFEFLLK